MIKKESGNRKLNTLFVKLACLTAIITMLSVFFSWLFPYAYLKKQIVYDIKQYNNQKLQRLKENLESSLFEPVYSFLNDFVITTEMYNIFKTMEREDGSLNPYSIIQLRDLLRSKILSHGQNFHDILIYHEKDEKIISANLGVRDLKDRSNKMPYDDKWINDLGDLSIYRTMKWLDIRKIPSYNSSNFTSTLNCVSVIIRINPKLQSGSPLYICVRIPDFEVVKTIEQINVDEHLNMILFMPSGEYIQGLRTAYSPPGKDKLAILKSNVLVDLLNSANFQNDTQEIYTGEYNDEVFSVMKSDINEWYYLMTTSRDHYYHASYLFNNITKVASIAIIFLVFLVSLIYIFKLTAPFGTLLNLMSVENRKIKENGTAEKSRTEIQLLVDTFNKLVETRDVQNIMLLKNQELVRQSLITQLFMGTELDNEEIMSCCKFCGLPIKHDNYLVVLLQFLSVDSDKAQILSETIDRSIESFTDENNQKADAITYRFSDELHALIINFEQLKIDLLESFLVGLIELLEFKYMIVGTASVGSVQKSVHEVSVSYRDANDALCYASYYPKLKILHNDETKIWDKNIQIDESVVSRLIMSVQNGHIENTSYYLKLLNDYIHNNNISYKATMKIIEKLINVVELYNIVNKKGDNPLSEVSLSLTVENLYYISDILNFIKDYIGSMFETRSVTKAVDISDEYTREVISYLEANYNRDISIQDISESVGVSRYHLSRLFKENTGMTLIDYLNKLRFKKAEILIKNTDLNINEVAKLVGFNNISYFNRKFKQIFGITPSQLYSETK